MARIINCLICDDVRMEQSGKVILIGIYGPDITFGETPANARNIVDLHIWAEVETPPNEPYEMQWRVIIEDFPPRSPERAGRLFKFNLEPGSGTYSQLDAPLPCRVDFRHALRIEMKMPAGNWEVVRRLNVIPSPNRVAPAAENTTPTTSE